MLFRSARGESRLAAPDPVNGASLSRRIEEVLTTGNLAGLTPAERVDYANAVCRTMGLNPFTQPFLYLAANNKIILYATAGCANQLQRLYNVSVELVSAESEGDLFVVRARATAPDGRSDEDMGVVYIKGVGGEALANARMKAVTKAKRRVILRFCGLGLLDESEIPAGAIPVQAAEVVTEPERPTAQDRIAPIMITELIRQFKATPDGDALCRSWLAPHGLQHIRQLTVAQAEKCLSRLAALRAKAQRTSEPDAAQADGAGEETAP